MTINDIEKNARDSAAVQEKLRQENESLKAEVDALRLQVDGLRTRLDAMDVERSRLTAELERETQRRQELELLEPEAARLSEEVERLPRISHGCGIPGQNACLLPRGLPRERGPVHPYAHLQYACRLKFKCNTGF